MAADIIGVASGGKDLATLAVNIVAPLALLRLANVLIQRQPFQTPV